ncbi:MAG: hypothetical protein U0795_25680 [Pirellulales bacterium]
MVKHWVWRAGGILVVAWAALAIGAETADVPVSKYVPIADLRQQLETYFAELEKDLASEAEYDAEHQGRVEKGANTLVVLAQALANHDGAGDEKRSAAGMMRGALAVAAGSADYTKAKAAWDQLQTARKTPGDAPAAPPGWTAEADLAQLMKQVPVVNNALRAGVTSRRFERSVEKTAGLAATLAAIAQASSVDFDYCSGDEDQQEWRKICLEMRDACAAVNEAVRQKNQDAATKGLEQIVATCDACHHRFRD